MNRSATFIKKVSFFVGVPVVLLLMLWYTLAFNEITSIAFSSYEAAKPSIQAGWLPEWLPKSAYEINESHDIDSNITWTKFRFSKTESFHAPFCSSIDKQRVRIPDDRYIKRFPVFVREMHKELTANTDLQFYDCSEPKWERYLAINDKNNLAYSWAIPRASGNPVAYYPATSGLPGYMDPKYQYERDKGPIPSGSYTMYPNQFTGGQLKSLVWNLMGLFGIRGGGDWGTWRVPLHPDAGTNIGNRTGGFFIHGGMFPGSKGCIDIGSNDTDFHNLLKNHKGPVKVIIFYPGLFIIPIRKLKRRRLRYFAANGFILGLILSAIYQAYILIANWKWTLPEPWFVTYMKGFFVLLFVISIYGRPLYFYWKHTALISKKEFMISWATAWLIFCIYLTVEVFFIHHSKVTPDEIIQLLTLLKDNTIFHYKLLIWTNIAGLFLKEIVWKFFLGNLISAIILLPFIICIYKRKEYDDKR